MKYIEIDDELYKVIASKTERIGESASDILRRLIQLPQTQGKDVTPAHISQPSLEAKPVRHMSVITPLHPKPAQPKSQSNMLYLSHRLTVCLKMKTLKHKKML